MTKALSNWEICFIKTVDIIANEKWKIMFFIVPGIIKTDYLERI